MLSFGEKIAKIGPVDPEIIIAGEIIIRLYTFGSVRVCVRPFVRQCVCVWACPSAVGTLLFEPFDL